MRDPSGLGAVKANKERFTGDFATLDDFLNAEGKLEVFEAIAVKEVLKWQDAELNPLP